MRKFILCIMAIATTMSGIMFSSCGSDDSAANSTEVVVGLYPAANSENQSYAEKICALYNSCAQGGATASLLKRSTSDATHDAYTITIAAARYDDITATVRKAKSNCSSVLNAMPTSCWKVEVSSTIDGSNVLGAVGGNDFSKERNLVEGTWGGRLNDKALTITIDNNLHASPSLSTRNAYNATITYGDKSFTTNDFQLSGSGASYSNANGVSTVTYSCAARDASGVNSSTNACTFIATFTPSSSNVIVTYLVLDGVSYYVTGMGQDGIEMTKIK